MRPYKLGQEVELLAIEALQYNSQPCIKLEDLWQALHQSFNLAQNHQVNLNVLDKILSKLTLEWLPFSKEKLRSATAKYNDLSIPGPDRIS